MSLPFPLRGKIKVDRRDESLFLFLEILPGRIRTFAPGKSTHSLPGEIHAFIARAPSSFFQFLHLKEAFQFFPNFTEAGNPSSFFQFLQQLEAAPFQEFPKMLAAGKTATSHHLLPTSSKETSRNFQIFQQLGKVPLLTIYCQLFPKKKLPKISKKVSSWKLPFFSKFYGSWETHFLENDPEKGKKFFKKKLDKNQKV